MKKLQQFNIIGIKQERLKNNNFDIELSLEDAENNDELIALADNECLRAVRRITMHKFDIEGKEKLKRLREERKRISRGENSLEARERIKSINDEIRELLYIPEIISVTTRDKRKYGKLGRDGFKLNGIRYKRLMCSAAMARTNRALFCSVDIYDRLDEILRCGCGKVKIVPAKWNTYYSLTSSAGFIVSKPRVCVVADCEITMKKRVDWVTDKEHEDFVENMDKDLPFNLWDGMGLISPEMAKKWSEEVGFEGIGESFIVRAPFTKGLLATFDFHKFAREIAGGKKIKDLYGVEHDAEDLDVILTQSQFKLWNGYDSMDSLQENMDKYGINWCVTNIGKPNEKNTIRTNYQFLQVLKMGDKDIEDICEPTLKWFKGIVNGDYNYKLLYLLGKIAKLDDPYEIWDRVQDNSIKALMLEPELIKDTYLSEKIALSINKKIKESYIGKLLIDGSFNFAYSDPYGLAEYCFGLEPKGLLKEGEFYAGFWLKRGINDIVSMRSPLTWRAEVNRLKLKDNDKLSEWFKYIDNGVIFNIWGLDREIHSSMDFDGDIVATTDNKVFLNCRYGYVPVLYKSQKVEKEYIEK